ncbi:Hypothetical predicted protein [Mytilus galloprovincialis]|uniref:ISXO2-like transposase domain-containing protein n=1 Tax=Mytilus galloprovincialis TaxID=29158 RepID=A0A8B6GKG3_MYTGA|nr:Hypothetical predicted protein [Mytilus galloprovincialis]
MFSLKFTVKVELDESLFGRKCKYHKGKDSGTNVWVFGIKEKTSNRIVLYPVDKRSREVLLPLIKRHVEAGSTIFSDGWAAYLTLNQEGYRHFAVSHASTFKQTYENPKSGERIDVDTNTIEGAWKHCRDHFKKINEVKLSTFESRLCEIVCRNHTSAQNVYKHPIFKDTFNMDDDEKVLRMSDVSDDDNNETLDPMTVEEVAEDAGEKEKEECNQPAIEPRRKRPQRKAARRSTSLPVTRGRAKRLACPSGYKPVEDQTEDHRSERRPRRPSNPYSKSNFISVTSSDEEFQ